MMNEANKEASEQEWDTGQDALIFQLSELLKGGKKGNLEGSHAEGLKAK